MELLIIILLVLLNGVFAMSEMSLVSSRKFKLENAKEVFNSYDSIVKKYYELNKEDFKQREIIRKQKELADLMAK